ncbi:GIY-YIG nuclease family protein [Candidatus Bathyarchaeota archaeon]|nr:GIY-YIG nuclease family protein [Candidatus Bathyarchaeota archaeon]
MERGAYSLIIEVQLPQKLMIGALGNIEFKKGYYVYVGSALGKGSTSLWGRIGRHLSRVKKPFWHIDYLLNSPEGVRVVAFVASPNEKRMECSVALALKAWYPSKALPIRGFGSSDCLKGCQGHLFYLVEVERLDEALQIVRLAHHSVGLAPRVYYS